MVETSAIVILRHDDGHAYISTTYLLCTSVCAPRNDMRILCTCAATVMLLRNETMSGGKKKHSHEQTSPDRFLQKIEIDFSTRTYMYCEFDVWYLCTVQCSYREGVHCVCSL